MMKRRMMKPMAYAEPFSQIKLQINKSWMKPNNIQHFILHIHVTDNNIPIISHVNIETKVLS